jgi:hypothetical protein
MTQHDDLTQWDQHSGSGRPRPFLSPEAASICGFSLAVLSLQGQGSWMTAVGSFFGTRVGLGAYGHVLTVAGLVALALAVAAVLLAGRVVRDGAVVGWPDHLARAAVVLGLLGGVFAVVTVAGGLVPRV